MSKKLLVSLATIGAVAAIAIGGTISYFSDTETSTGNTFTAGELDLKVSNESYVTDPATGRLMASEPTSWVSGDLTVEKFFNFDDVKPGDVGEDTIDITVVDNDAWVCAELTLTSNIDNGCTDPEMAPDPNCNPQSADLWDGDLAQAIEFVWWADDGDNVLEVDEEATKYYLGPASITSLLGDDNYLLLTLADSRLNFFNPQNGGPLEGGVTYYVGKGWCYGEMTLTPVDEGEGGPLVRGTGFECDGSVPGNEGQSDRLTADITFTATQARNQENYLCPEHSQAICGNGILEAGEQCDDGNQIDTDNCHNDCTLPGICVAKPDVMQVLDRSGSVSGDITILKSAAHAFVTALDPKADGAWMGQTSFADTGSLDLQLTSDKTAIDAAIDTLVSTGLTNLYEGISLANTEFATGNNRDNNESPNYMVIITDGEPNEPEDNTNARTVAIGAADAADAAGTIIYVVGIGVTIDNATWLANNIATGPSYYFDAANFAALEAILLGIATCQP